MNLTEEMLRQAAQEVTEEWLRRIPEESHTFSRRFRRRMRPLLANPAGYVRSAARPLWRKVLRAAACVVLACALALGTLRAVSPETYAAVVRWVAEWYETHVVYYFRGEPEEIYKEEALPLYAITALPEGYEETGEPLETPGYRGIYYRNSQGQEIYFTCEYIPQGNISAVFLDDVTAKEIMVGDSSGQMYLAKTPDQSNGIVWADEEAGILFSIDAFAEESVLLHMAESVSLVETPK